MEPNHLMLFREIELAVSRLMFGDEDASTEVYRNLVGSALRQLGVDDVCRKYCSTNEEEH